jgi:hypothetical protein
LDHAPAAQCVPGAAASGGADLFSNVVAAARLLTALDRSAALIPEVTVAEGGRR